jgi:hypothetical protein
MTADPDEEIRYPGGASSPAYRIAFQAWIAVALLVVCTSLLRYLGMWFTMANR